MIPAGNYYTNDKHFIVHTIVIGSDDIIDLTAKDDDIMSNVCTYLYIILIFN